MRIITNKETNEDKDIFGTYFHLEFFVNKKRNS